MKAIKYSAIALAATALFAACDDDRDDNPVLAPVSEFHLNTPAFVNQLVDLGLSDSLTISWDQPSYGFPIVVNYNVEVSKTGEFTTSYAQQTADETGATKADYYSFDATQQCSQNIAARDFSRAIAALSSWEGEADVPAEQELYVRVKACPSSKSDLGGTMTSVSNAFKFSTRPVYVALKDADPQLWYLIGACIGDGKWTNNNDGFGVSTFPFSIISGAKYDSNTGVGAIVFNGYLTTDGFKVIKTIGSWDEQIGSGDGGFVFRDGGSGNITVDKNGYYKVTMNTASATFGATDKTATADGDIVIEPLESTPAVYETMSIAGDFNGWDDECAMTPVSTAECVKDHNHLWTYELEVPEGGTTLMFTTPSWGSNWGGNEFPYGVGVSGGGNISVPAGSYTVTFNDVDGTYAFFAK